jgi:hypothetical protein
VDRPDWKAALAGTEEAWERAYERQPGAGPTLVDARDAHRLADDLNPDHVMNRRYGRMIA